MKPRVLALHGFLGRGSDWDAVRRAAGPDWEWHCPDLFSPEAADWRLPPDLPGPAWLAGYSFGARLALRWLESEPGRWCGALLLSANPGNFQCHEERAARRLADSAWAAAFRQEPWDDLLRRWNEQPVLAGGATSAREEKDFDRGKLASALEDFSVSGQSAETSLLREPLVWMAGAQDGKFAGLLGRMREAGFPGRFREIAGAGHRLLIEAPESVAGELVRLAA